MTVLEAGFICKHVNSSAHTQKQLRAGIDKHTGRAQCSVPPSSLSELCRGGTFPRVIWYLPNTPELASAPLYGQGGGTAWFLNTPPPSKHNQDMHSLCNSLLLQQRGRPPLANHLPQDLHRRHFGPPRGHPGGHRYPAAMRSPQSKVKREQGRTRL